MKNCNMILTESAKNISIIIWKNWQVYLTGEEIFPSNETKIPSSLRKFFEKQAKKIEYQGKKQIKAIEDYWKHVVESDELTKKDFNIDRDSIPFEERKKIFNEHVEEKSSEFKSLEKRINPDNLSHNYKNEGINSKSNRVIQRIKRW